MADSPWAITNWKDTLAPGASRVPTPIASPEAVLPGQAADWDKDFNRWISRNDWVTNPWGHKVISGSSEYWDLGNPEKAAPAPVMPPQVVSNVPTQPVADSALGATHGVQGAGDDVYANLASYARQAAANIPSPQTVASPSGPMPMTVDPAAAQQLSPEVLAAATRRIYELMQDPTSGWVGGVQPG
jgi:hypothetical protein